MQLLPIADGCLPAGCDAILPPPAGGDVCTGRAWIEATLRHAMPAGATAVIALSGGAVLLPLMQAGRSLGSLTTPYSLAWRPLGAAAAMHRAGQALGRHLRGGPPARFEALDPADRSSRCPSLPPSRCCSTG